MVQGYCLMEDILWYQDMRMGTLLPLQFYAMLQSTWSATRKKFLEQFFSACRYVNGATIFTTSGIAARKFQNEVEAGLVGINVTSPSTDKGLGRPTMWASCGG
ncbi:hypothetical protein K1719_037481 [Acacia pycnantha]|nr:hypothetical protein K1719_037481 [Acacia pycnantha]